jgi:hypothetical protein
MSHLFLISYDLRQPGKDYMPLYDKIKSLGLYYRPLERTWIVSLSDGTPETVYNAVRPALDDSDSLFVVDITGRPREGWLGSRFWEWLKTNNL